MQTIDVTFTYIGIVLAVLQVIQIIASWIVYCETNIVKFETVRARKVVELTRQDTKQLQQSFRREHGERIGDRLGVHTSEATEEHSSSDQN